MTWTKVGLSAVQMHFASLCSKQAKNNNNHNNKILSLASSLTSTLLLVSCQAPSSKAFRTFCGAMRTPKISHRLSVIHHFGPQFSRLTHTLSLCSSVPLSPTFAPTRSWYLLVNRIPPLATTSLSHLVRPRSFQPSSCHHLIT